MKIVDDIFGPDVMAEALKKKKITPEFLAAKLKAELNAKETKFFQHEGRVISKRSMIAWGIRQRARMDAHKLSGHYPADELDVNHKGTVEIQVISYKDSSKKDPDKK